MTANEKLQQAYREYQEANNHLASGTKEVVKWALQNGLLEFPEIDLVDIMARNMARALRVETVMDSHGRKVRRNYPARVDVDGVQYTLWAEGEYATPVHMETHFSQRREAIISDNYHLKIEVDHWNQQNPDRPPYQLILDYTDDVAEREAVEDFDDFQNEFDEAA